MNTIKLKFDEIYEATYYYVLKYVVSKCDNIHDVEDIIQNVYISFYQTMEKKGETYIRNEKAYLIKLCKSELFKYYSFKNKIKYILNTLHIQDDTLDIFEIIEDENIDITKEVHTKMEAERIWNSIQQEDIVTIKIMTLFYINDMKISEIAEALDVKESYVKNKLYRTLKKIKIEMEDE